jgi:hypothetical protein
MVLTGKGFFIWKVRECENGDSQAIAAQAAQSGLTHLLVKIADGTYSYNIDPSGVDLVTPIVQACHARGILVYGWQYVYGEDPVGEANKAIQRIHQTKVDGFVIDVEKEFKEPGKEQAALKYMERLRAAYPNLTLALSSYRFPSYHPQIPWDVFLERCNINMPQVYWVLAHNPAEQLERCVREFQSITPYRPIIPTGSAYRSGGWQATPDEVTAFMDKARQLNLTAVNFWEWANCRTYISEVWRAIARYPWPGGPAPKDIVQQYIDALNSRDVSQIINLYSPNPVHINAARTIQGITALRSWYQTLLTQILPNATFNLTGFSGTGNSRQFNWTANSTNGKVRNGSDTFGLLDGKIGYHYTFFDVVK